ncbi:MAG TPA: hypothetical protein VGP71_04215 [Burkholderiales bacterium]|jgi:hypothetical protein|nr:hypothetical protein [Burkholderiales bacterium]
MTSPKVKTFEQTILLPALDEVCKAPALLREYVAEPVKHRPSVDANAEELLESLAGAMRRPAGPSLVLTNRTIPPDVSRLAGRYVMTVFYDGEGDEVCASPAVLFWMRFNNKLHVFNHRYDNAIARHRIEEITRPHVLNHVLRSFDFYKLYAFSAEPFPGYR